MRISKARSSGSPARSSVASSRVSTPMSSWDTLRARPMLKSAGREPAAGPAALAPPASIARMGMRPISWRRAMAAGLLEASSTPSCTSPAGETALYWKNGIGWAGGLVLARHAQDFLDGGDPGERLPQAVLEHRLHPLHDRRRADVAGGRVPHDERADVVGDGHHLDDADASPVTGAGALLAAH